MTGNPFFPGDRDEGDTAHPDMHTHIDEALNGAIYAANYTDLQDALDDAVTYQVPLVIGPNPNHVSGEWEIDTGLLVTGATGLHIVGQAGYRTVIRATTTMDTLIELNGCNYSSISNLYLTTAAVGVTVGKMLHVTHTPGVNTSSQILINRMQVGGTYVTGIHVGEPTSTGQVDTVTLMNCIVQGDYDLDDVSGNWLYGVYLGSNAWGNHLEYRLYTVDITGVQTCVYVAATSAYIVNGSWGRAAVGVYNNAFRLIIDSIRTDGNMTHFMESPTGAFTRSGLTELRNIEFNLTSEDWEPADNIWMIYGLNGSLRLINVYCSWRHDGISPQITIEPYVACAVTTDCLFVRSYATLATYAGAFDSNANVDFEGRIIAIDNAGQTVGILKPV